MRSCCSQKLHRKVVDWFGLRYGRLPMRVRGLLGRCVWFMKCVLRARFVANAPKVFFWRIPSALAGAPRVPRVDSAVELCELPHLVFLPPTEPSFAEFACPHLACNAGWLPRKKQRPRYGGLWAVIRKTRLQPVLDFRGISL